MYFGYDPNILSYYDNHPEIHDGGSPSNGHSASPLSAIVQPIQNANDQSQPHKQVQQAALSVWTLWKADEVYQDATDPWENFTQAVSEHGSTGAKKEA